MDLKKFLPSLKDDEKIEHYWALVIEPGYVQAGIWRIQNQKAQVIYTSIDSAWELDEELVTACDTALSSAISTYPEGYEEPTKTVFGVSYNWVSGGEIKPEFLSKIKKVCKDLSLTPVGFVVLPEAISHLIKSEEGTPLNAIILGVYKENIELSLFQLGKLVGTTQVARSVSLTDDVVEGINRLSQGDTLPSRFLIYDGKEGDLEEIRQTLIKSNWEDFENVKFLHTPKVELIGTKKKIYAVALAGASEIANVTLLEDVASKIQEEPEPRLEENNTENIADDIAETEVSPEELGFALERDVRTEPDLLVEDRISEDPRYKETESNFKPINDADFIMEHDQLVSHANDLINSEKNNHEEPPTPPRVQSLTKERKPIFNGVNSHLVKMFSPFKKFQLRAPRMNLKNTPLIFGSLFVIILLILGGLFWWFVPKSTVTIYVSPQKIEESMDIIVDSKATSIDVSQKKLPGTVLETSVSGDRTMDTSGTKTVGDKAKGTVTIYRVGPELSLPAGTVLVGPDKLKFSLDNSQTIASGSGITTPGETKVAVTAQDIGSQFNLASGTTFSIGNYSTSDMEAKNEASFAGGSSKEVSSVSKDDQVALQKSLEEELKEKAESQLGEGLEVNKYLIKESEKTENSETKFDHKVGDEAKTLKLSLTVKASAVVINTDDLIQISTEALKNEVPKGFVLRGEQLKFGFENGAVSGNEYKFKVKVSANLLPDLKTDDIAKKIAGKYPKLAEDYLRKEAPGFVKTEIRIKPSFPGKLKTLPHVIKNIDVLISAEK